MARFTHTVDPDKKFAHDKKHETERSYLKDMEEQGWELVSVILTATYTEMDVKTYYWKKPISS